MGRGQVVDYEPKAHRRISSLRTVPLPVPLGPQTGRRGFAFPPLLGGCCRFGGVSPTPSHSLRSLPIPPPNLPSYAQGIPSINVPRIPAGGEAVGDGAWDFARPISNLTCISPLPPPPTSGLLPGIPYPGIDRKGRGVGNLTC